MTAVMRTCTDAIKISYINTAESRQLQQLLQNATKLSGVLDKSACNGQLLDLRPIFTIFEGMQPGRMPELLDQLPCARIIDTPLKDVQEFSIERSVRFWIPHFAGVWLANLASRDVNGLKGHLSWLHRREQDSRTFMQSCVDDSFFWSHSYIAIQHGLIWQMVATSVASLDVIKELCSTSSDWQVFHECWHGVGHGLYALQASLVLPGYSVTTNLCWRAFKLPYVSMAQVLTNCSALHQAATTSCVDGAFHSYFTYLPPLRASEWPSFCADSFGHHAISCETNLILHARISDMPVMSMMADDSLAGDKDTLLIDQAAATHPAWVHNWVQWCSSARSIQCRTQTCNYTLGSMEALFRGMLTKFP